MSAACNIIGIVCALKEEAHGLLPYVQVLKEFKIKKLTVFEANYEGKKIYIVVSGMGEKNAVKACQYLIDLGIECLINFGTAGGVAPDVKVGDVIVSSYAVNYDNNPLFRYEADSVLLLKALSVGGLRKGVIASADKNVATACQREFLYKRYGALCCDWESAAVLRIAQENKVAALALRVISDVGTKQPLIEEFRANLPKVLEAGREVLLSVIDRI